MNAVRNKLSSFAQWARGLLATTAKPTAQDPPRPSPSPVKRIQSPTLSRRALLSSLPLMAVPWSVARALEAVLPFDDGWRYGWIFPQDPLQASVYYGIDLGRPEHLVIYISRNGLLTSVTLAELKENHFTEAAAEIDISQGHAGVMAGRPEDDFVSTLEVEMPDEPTVMLEGTSVRDEEMAIQRAAHGRDATEKELSQAEDPKYHLITGPTPRLPGDDRFYVNAMVDEATFHKGQAIMHEGWPMSEDAITRLRALVHDYALKHGA